MSVYKIVELVGTSPTSWEEAAKDVIETATKSLRDIRILRWTSWTCGSKTGRL